MEFALCYFLHWIRLARLWSWRRVYASELGLSARMTDRQMNIAWSFFPFRKSLRVAIKKVPSVQEGQGSVSFASSYF